MSTNCDTCINSHEKSSLEGGGFECRRNPPQVVIGPTHGGIQLVSMFPPVNDKMSCSFYETGLPEIPGIEIPS